MKILARLSQITQVLFGPFLRHSEIGFQTSPTLPTVSSRPLRPAVARDSRVGLHTAAAAYAPHHAFRVPDMRNCVFHIFDYLRLGGECCLPASGMCGNLK